MLNKPYYLLRPKFTWKSIWNSNKGLVIAVLVSLFFHVFLLGTWQFSLPAIDSNNSIIVARLLPLSERSVKQGAAEAKPVLKPIKPKPKPNPPKEIKAAPPEEIKAAPPEEIKAAPPEELPMPQAAENQAKTAQQSSLPAVAESPVSNESDELVSQETAAEPPGEVPPSPSFVELDFEVLRGINGSKVAETQMRYKVHDDGTYALSSETKPRGIASFFLPKRLMITSEGTLTSHGLRPSQYLYQVEGKDNKTNRANFDWAAAVVTMETEKGKKIEPLPAGTQDFLSFMYQFMFVAPLNNMQLSLADGKKLRLYHYQFVGEESLSTTAGTLVTAHIEKSSGDEQEKAELWLATNYRWLPVKIRKTEKDGSVIEQVVTRVSIGDVFSPNNGVAVP